MIERFTLWYLCVECWGVWLQGEMPCACEAEVLAYRGLAHQGRPIEDVPVGDYF